MTTPDPNVPPQQPGVPQDGDPAARSAYGQQPAYGQTPAGYGQPPVENPGRTLGIVGLVLGFFGPLSLIGLILSIVGLRKSKKVGQPNGVAVAGIVVSSLVLAATIILSIVLGVAAAQLIETCNDLGPGTHVENGITYTCNF